ncbi:PREDICTED: uncharacterized protein LOC104595617 [Nelumbo nucifera]|uniref:Uncharacterized protein LOC104595617 n=1 Tax=Nelumbo nucifera TaxID=4432 RepID=A0A1U7ZL25_NELNU|nr:PREDICTED: uncharacterized protein LOC104595617 [Nelumbo nucifera]
MGIMLLKKFAFLFLLVSASLLSVAFAGRQLMGKPIAEVNASNKEAAADVHERILRVNTRDYGIYDPAPSLVKPPFKSIPN